MSVEALRNVPMAEPKRLRAGILAILVHVIFIGLMVFGLNWKTQPPEGMVVDLWQDLPSPMPEPKVSEPPVQPKQQPKQQPKPAQEPVKQKPAPEAIKVAPPPPQKPDIALKKAPEKPKPEKEIKPDPEELKKKEQERLAAEKESKEKAEAERLQREKEQQRKREQAAQQKREQEAQAAARARVMSEVAKYKAMILAKIKSRIVMPPDLPGNPVTEFRVTLLPGGDILDVSLRKSSGYAAFDSAVERAIHLSTPLPLPPDPALFNEFRNLHVTVHYLE